MTKVNCASFRTPFKLFFTIVLMSFITFLIFDSCIEKVNQEYESFGAFYFFMFLSIIIGIISVVLSHAVFLNKLSFVRKSGLLSYVTFFLPVLPAASLVVPNNAKNVSVILFSLIPLSVLLLQTHNFIRFRKQVKSVEPFNSL